MYFFLIVEEMLGSDVVNANLFIRENKNYDTRSIFNAWYSVDILKLK